MRFAFLSLVSILLTGCGLFGGGGPGATEWEATLQPQTNFTGIQGSASATATEGMTTVRANLSGAPAAGAQYPWHIHAGSCGSNGSIVGPMEAYPALMISNDMGAQATATLNVELTRGAQYYVDVHRSREDMATVVACGNLMME